MAVTINTLSGTSGGVKINTLSGEKGGVIIDTLSGKNYGVKINNLSLDFERPSSVAEHICQVSYKFVSDTLYLICYNSSEYNRSFKALYYEQSGEVFDSERMPARPCLFLSWDFGSNTRYRHMTLKYNPEEETLTLYDSSSNTSSLATSLEEWEIYKIPLTINFTE